jgi:hypothetical protein
VSDDAAKDQARRRRADRLLGDLVPETSMDETDEGWSESEDSPRDDELRRDVPPHHG